MPWRYRERMTVVGDCEYEVALTPIIRNKETITFLTSVLHAEKNLGSVTV
jgi:hypothetical protein